MEDVFGSRVQLLVAAKKANNLLRKQFYEDIIYKEYYSYPVEERKRDKLMSYLHRCGASVSIYSTSISITGCYNTYHFRRHHTNDKSLKIERLPEEEYINISRSEKIDYYRKLVPKIEEEIDEINKITPDVLKWMEDKGY